MKVQLTPEADRTVMTAKFRLGNNWMKALFRKPDGWDAASSLELCTSSSAMTRYFNDAVARGEAWKKLGAGKPWVRIERKKDGENANTEA